MGGDTCGWEGNSRSDVALSTCNSLVVLQLQAQGLGGGDEHLPTLYYWSMVNFTSPFHRVPEVRTVIFWLVVAMIPGQIVTLCAIFEVLSFICFKDTWGVSLESGLT